MTNVNQLVTLIFSVRRRRLGDVPNRKPKTLLHRNEKAGKEKTAESDQKTVESILGDVLRFVELETIRNCDFYFDFFKHVDDGD